MKKISCFLLAGAVCALCADAGAKSLTDEIRSGLKNYSGHSSARSRNHVGAQRTGALIYQPLTAENVGAGELGHEVFYDEQPVAYDDDEGYRLFIPTSMYIRMGGGMNLGFATTKAHVGDEKYSSKDSWNLLVGLGWNMSSYVRTEIEFQRSSFRFSGLPGENAYYNMINGMLYFDLARRYVQSGDITYRRTIVPFMGFGMGIGMYDFAGDAGASGLSVAIPRAELGVNFMLTDMLGLDIYYQYQMLFEHGFGWNTTRIGVDSISNIMATFRVNF